MSDKCDSFRLESREPFEINKFNSKIIDDHVRRKFRFSRVPSISLILLKREKDLLYFPLLRYRLKKVRRNLNPTIDEEEGERD